jgi:hypothetical protein
VLGFGAVFGVVSAVDVGAGGVRGGRFVIAITVTHAGSVASVGSVSLGSLAIARTVLAGTTRTAAVGTVPG